MSYKGALSCGHWGSGRIDALLGLAKSSTAAKRERWENCPMITTTRGNGGTGKAANMVCLLSARKI